MKHFLVQFMKDYMSRMQIQKEEPERLKEKGVLCSIWRDVWTNRYYFWNRGRGGSVQWRM